MASHRDFYLKAYTDRSSSAINQCIQQFNVTNAVQAVTTVFKLDDVAADQLLAIKYFSYGITGLLIEWLQGADIATLAELAQFQYQNTPAFLKTAYQHYNFPNVSL